MEHSGCFVNDEEVFLYIDSELDQKRTDFLNQHIKGCSRCEFRYQVYSQLKTRTKAQVSSVKTPERLVMTVTSQIRSPQLRPEYNFWENLGAILRGRPLLPIGAVAVLVVVFFVALTAIPKRAGTMPLVTEMIHEHYEYMNGFAGKIGIESCDPGKVTEWISSHTGMNMALPSAKESPSLVGACAFEEDDNNITCVFFDDSSKRVTLFVMSDKLKEVFGQKTLNINNKKMLCGRCTDMNYVAWQSKGMFCVLVGDLPEQRLVAMAENLI